MQQPPLLPRGVGRPVFAVAFVACLYLITLPGTWIGTDQGEMILTAQRLVERGTFTLADDGRLPVKDAPWATHRAGQPVRSRLHPATSVLSAPLVMLDRALGYRDPLRNGHVIYLQGFAFATAALALLGYFLRAAGAAPGDASLAILFVGTSYPLWTVSRAGGAEPILAVAAIAYAGAREAARSSGSPDRFLAVRAGCLLLMPWIHPIGFVLAPVFGVAESLWSEAAARRIAAVVASAGVMGSLVFSLLWSYGYHGQLLAGGYAQAGGWSFFDTNPLYGAWTLIRDLVRDAPFVLALPLLAALLGDARSRAAWPLPALGLALIVALFASLFEREAVRRFAPLMPLLGLPLGLGWPRLAGPIERAQLLVLASIAWSLQRLLAVMGAYYPGPDGLFYPAIVWFKLAIDQGWSASWAVPVLVLGIALVVLWRRVFPAASVSPATARSADR